MTRRSYHLRLPRQTLSLGPRTLLMGVLNVTPDSFSDGGEFFDLDRAIARALEIQAEGADILDVGGESTRPGALPISAEEEINRVIPVLRAIRRRLHIPISIDTTKEQVARAALEAGADIINDISGLAFEPRLADLAATWGAGLVLMHTRGTPDIMQQLEPSPDIFAEIEEHFRRAIDQALRSGVRREQIILDPGIGFGKTLQDNLSILNNLDRLAPFDLPLLIGPSRKSFIGRLTGKQPRERVFGTAAAVTAAIFRGAHIVRVHDVAAMLDVVRIADAVINTSRFG
jgi:dihydropteroate synthase